ncbi:MAG TPA: hypothetical protein VER33_19950 [Polyangiaceae bacterium]|nr:hypothetical protein [Polyangiaceae bacterium]
MKNACPRLFDVEALRDGRFAGSERAHFENHLGVCHPRASEAQALQALGEALRASSDVWRQIIEGRQLR